MAFHCCFTHHKGIFAGICLLFVLLSVLLSAAPLSAQEKATEPDFPLDMEQLLVALSDAQRPELDDNRYPRLLEYHHQRWNVLDDSLTSEEVTLSVEQQPQRIIPHAVGLTEVLWAITPHERIISVHETCRNPDYSFLAGQLPDSLPTYGSEDAELVIGFCPDLVLTTYYSSASFKNRLTLSHIPFVEMGFFGDIASIEQQICFLGELVGAEASARQLLTTMQQSVASIRHVVKQRLAGRTLRVLYYDRMGFVAGEHSTFDSLCRILGIENVATQNDIKFFKQVGYETVLKWDPDIIIVPEDSGLDQRLLGQPILATSKAIRNRNIRTIPGVYLMASSQFVVASLNYLGGILYEK
ncbi:MAG: ABC transporter substrate-binding protein [Desulfuromonas sp.]|nr:ABC transporter substrate-binding protein [Desulfuromonas sp.]